MAPWREALKRFASVSPEEGAALFLSAKRSFRARKCYLYREPVALLDGMPEDGFYAGCIGYGARTETPPDANPRLTSLPDAAIYLYAGCWELDSFSGLWRPLGEPPPLPEPGRPGDCRVTGGGMDFSGTDYRAAVEGVRELILEGEVYQLNLTARRTYSFKGDPAGLLWRMLEVQPVAYGALVSLGEGRFVVSASPELFLSVRGREALSSPMKGTAPITTDRRALRRSEKERAENVMIVDVMRNDLTRACDPLSVTWGPLYRVERFNTLWQMTSDVRGRLANGKSSADLFAAAFPPASVTGAPKIRAMQLIDGIERSARGIYCGSVACSVPGRQTCSVAIRTAEIDRDTLVYGAGCGIVLDSDPEREWQELLLKCEAFERAVGV